MNLRHISESLTCTSCTSKTCLVLNNCQNTIESFSESRRNLVFEKGNRLNNSLSDGVYILSEGKLKIYNTGKRGEEIILNFIKPGEFFNIFRNEQNKEYPFQIQALEDSAVCFVDEAAFNRIAKSDPVFLLSFFKSQNNKLNNIQSRFLKTMTMNVPAKVADALITMYDTYGTDVAGNLDVKLSRFEIAGLATTTKEQVSKAITEFKTAGLIKSKAKKIAILDYAKLKAVSNQ